MAAPGTRGVEGGQDAHPATAVAVEFAAKQQVARAETLSHELEAQQREISETVLQVEHEEERQRRETEEAEKARAAMEEALQKLQAEEEAVLAEVEQGPHRRMMSAFLARQHELEVEERSLLETLRQQEATLAELRSKLAHPSTGVLPRDEERARVYLLWKRALAKREELLREARARKHDLMQELKARHESQVVLLELERRAAVEALEGTMKEESEQHAALQEELAAVEASIGHAAASMETFRKEFDQLRVAMLLDRMAKNVQVSGLLAKRQQLATQAQAFQATIEAAKEEAAATAKREWDSKLEAEHKAGADRLRAQAEEIEAKMGQVRSTLAERYESGFAPLLAEAEERHLQEVNRVTRLQKQLEEKEKALEQAHQRARQLAAATADADDTSDGSTVEATADEMAQFEKLRNSIGTLWEQLDMPMEDVVSFLSEVDSIAPFNRRVYNLYAHYHAELAKAGEEVESPVGRASKKKGAKGVSSHRRR